MGSSMRRLPRKHALAALGELAGFAAALGLVARQDLQAGRRPSRASLGDRVGAHPAAFVALFALGPLAAGLLGRALGTRLDRHRELERSASRLEEEFAGMVAHDFRDPLAALLAQVGALKRRARDGETLVRISDLQRLEKLGWRLDRLVGDLFDSMLVEHESVPLRRRAVSLPAEVSALLGRLAPMLAGHPVSLQVEGEPSEVLVDPVRADQILANLLENAAKFSPPGTPIELVVAAARGGATVAVRDHGVGIGPEELEQLFDRWYQARRARENKTGLGLGLYLTKGLVEAHGGTIGVESALGRGTTFRIFFPAASRRESEARPAP